MIALRDVQPDDIERIRQWRNLPHVAQYMYTDHLITPEEHEKWFRRILQDPSCRYWIIVCDGQDVGVANIYNLEQSNQRCYWAFYVASPDVRGKGVGSFRFGFKEEGLFREHVWKGGVPRDVVCMAMLRHEWEAVKAESKDRSRQKGLL